MGPAPDSAARASQEQEDQPDDEQDDTSSPQNRDGQQEAKQEVRRAATSYERPEFGAEDLGDINIPAFLRNRI